MQNISSMILNILHGNKLLLCPMEILKDCTQTMTTLTNTWAIVPKLAQMNSKYFSIICDTKQCETFSFCLLKAITIQMVFSLCDYLFALQKDVILDGVIVTY